MNEVRHSLDRLAASTERLLASAAALSDAQLREPSPLPGWSRGHVLSHIARNADGLRNLLIWARTGIELLAWLTGRDDGTALTVSPRPAVPGREPAAGHGGLPPKLPTWA